MKIIHIVPGKANPDRMNGVNKVVHQLSTVMHEKGVDVSVIGITGNSDQTTAIRSYPLMIFKGNIRSFILGKKIQAFIADLSENSRVHFHGVLSPQFFSLAYLLRKKKIPYFVTPHGALLHRSMQKNQLLKKIYTALFDQFFLSGAKAIHAITAQEQKELQDNYQNIPVTVIPNGYPYTEKVISNQQNPLTFCYIGRLAAQHKGLDELIVGFTQFYQKHQKGVLWIIGEGRDREKIENLISRSGIRNQIILFGEQHGERKEKLLEQVSVFVHPSRWDVLPTAILEAAAYQKPLLVTKATGFKSSVVKWKSGIVIDETNANQISEAFEKFLILSEENKMAEMGSNAGSMIKNEYNWQEISNRFSSDLYGV